MTNLQAALGLAQLERLKEFIAHKKLTTKLYNEGLDKSFIRQKPQKHSDIVAWANAYRHPKALDIIRDLGSVGIECRPGFKGNDTIVLPCSTKLTTEDIKHVIQQANHYQN